MASSLGQGCSESWMKSWGRRRGNPSQKLILAEMHPLDYVAAVVEHSSNILRVYCACKVWITVMFTISAGCADPLDETKENCYMKSQGNMTCGEGRGLGGGGDRGNFLNGILEFFPTRLIPRTDSG